MEQAQQSTADRPWFITSRWLEYRGELTANLLRIVAVGVFYSVQLLHYVLAADTTGAAAEFHQIATLAAVAAASVALLVHLLLRQHYFPAWLKYASTGADLLLLTLLAHAGSRAASPLVFGYFLIVALAALRHQPRLVSCATLAAIIGYLTLIAASGRDAFSRNPAVALVELMLVPISLGMTGLVLVLVLRQSRLAAYEYAQRRGRAAEGEAR